MADITRKRGDTFPIVMLVAVDGVALDITASTFLLTVDPAKEPADDTNNICQLVGVVTDGPAGEVSFTPTANQMGTAGTFFYDVQMTDAAGAVRTIESGKFKLTQDITKD